MLQTRAGIKACQQAIMIERRLSPHASKYALKRATSIVRRRVGFASAFASDAGLICRPGRAVDSARPTGDDA